MAAKHAPGPLEIRAALKDAERNYQEAEAASSSSPLTAYRLGYVHALRDALEMVKWEEYGLG